MNPFQTASFADVEEDDGGCGLHALISAVWLMTHECENTARLLPLLHDAVKYLQSLLSGLHCGGTRWLSFGVAEAALGTLSNVALLHEGCCMLVNDSCLHPAAALVAELLANCADVQSSPVLCERALVVLHNVATWQSGAVGLLQRCPAVPDALLFAWKTLPRCQREMAKAIARVLISTSRAHHLPPHPSLLSIASDRRDVEE